MMTRTRGFLILVLCVLSAMQGAYAEHFCLRAKCKKEKRLAPELALVRHAKSHYLGVCRDGKAVFDIPAGQVQTMQTMATNVDKEVPATEEQSKTLLISYTNAENKPSAETLQAAGLNVVEDYEKGSFLVVQPVHAVSAQTVETLMADEAVTYAAPNYIMSIQPLDPPPEPLASVASTVPNDPYLPQLWGMTNCGATKVWPSFHETPNVIVAVIDTGVDYSHPDLKDNMWVSKSGKHGYDFYDNDEDPMDEDNHGTHCAGTIAGVGNNGVGVVGVSWKAQIMAMRFLGPDGSGSTSDAVKCIDWAVANGAHILSNSWAGPDSSQELYDAVSRAEKKGVLFVAAAGNTINTGNNNDSHPYYPAALPQPNIISVGAIDSNNARGSFSHYGKQSVDIGAPGVSIMSTTRNNTYSSFNGTSMATPHVAGAAAMVWGKTFATPQQNASQMTTVRDLIYTNARPVEALKTYWGQAAPAKIPGGVLDISFLQQASPNNNSPGTPTQPRLRFAENRMRVNPARLRELTQ